MFKWQFSQCSRRTRVFWLIILAAMVVAPAAVTHAQQDSQKKQRTKQNQTKQRGQRTASLEQLRQRIPDDVRFTPDITYHEGSEARKLDLFVPAVASDQPRPALVVVHGGGWRGGDKRADTFFDTAVQYAQKGYVCISVNYRLTAEAPFPACVEDVKCAVRWLRAHAKQYNVDSDRFGAFGNSAGAHLVAMLGLVGRDAGLEGDGPYQEYSSRVQAVCPAATPTDFPNWTGGMNRFANNGSLLAGPRESLMERAKKASPITYVSASAPPFLIIHGTADRTVNISQGDSFVEALKKAGAKDVTYIRIDDAGHGVFNQHSDQTHPAMEAFFARTIGRGAAGPQRAAVPEGINRSFEDPDVAQFVGRFEREGREVFDHRQQIIEACRLRPGINVADIGAGTGLFTRLIAPRIGDGQVYAVDIAEKFVQHVEQTSREKGITNITGVVCDQQSVNLPENSIDLAFISDTYHHFEYPYQTMRSIHRALRPGGQVVLIDFDRIEGVSDEWVLNHVRAGQEVFTAEIVAAGFRLVEDNRFMDTTYFLRFEKVEDGR